MCILLPMLLLVCINSYSQVAEMGERKSINSIWKYRWKQAPTNMNSTFSCMKGMGEKDLWPTDMCITPQGQKKKYYLSLKITLFTYINNEIPLLLHLKDWPICLLHRTENQNPGLECCQTDFHSTYKKYAILISWV